MHTHDYKFIKSINKIIFCFVYQETYKNYKNNVEEYIYVYMCVCFA